MWYVSGSSSEKVCGGLQENCRNLVEGNTITWYTGCPIDLITILNDSHVASNANDFVFAATLDEQENKEEE